MLPRDAVMEKRKLTAAIAMISTRMLAESSVFIIVTFADSVQLCYQMFLREIRVIGSQLYYQLKRKLLRGLKKLLLKL